MTHDDDKTKKVSGVSCGTGIEPDVAGYNGRPTDFAESAPGGVGAVLFAAKAVYRASKVLGVPLY